MVNRRIGMWLYKVYLSFTLRLRKSGELACLPCPDAVNTVVLTIGRDHRVGFSAAGNSLGGVDKREMSKSLVLDEQGVLWFDVEPGEQRNVNRSCVLCVTTSIKYSLHNSSSSCCCVTRGSGPSFAFLLGRYNTLGDVLDRPTPLLRTRVAGGVGLCAAIVAVVMGREIGCDFGSFLRIDRFLGPLMAYTWFLRCGVAVTAGSLLVMFLTACKFTDCEARTVVMSICSNSM